MKCIRIKRIDIYMYMPSPANRQIALILSMNAKSQAKLRFIYDLSTT